MRRIVFADTGYCIYGANDDEIDRIKDSLTFKNPVYDTVKKFSKWKNTKVPPFLTYYFEGEDEDGRFIEVPYGFNLYEFIGNFKFINSRADINKDVEFPDFKLKLRGDQKIAAKKYIKENFYDSLHKGVIVLPTGKGKTILALYLAWYISKRTLVIVHKDDLMEGWKRDIAECFGEDFKPGIVKASKRFVGNITLATIQTLARMKEEELEKYLDLFDFVVCDECHHCPSNMFKVSSYFSSRYRLGLTATPERSDGLGHVIRLFFGETCYEYEDKGVDEDILPCEVITRDVGLYYDPLVWYTVVEPENPAQKEYFKILLEDKWADGSSKVKAGQSHLSALTKKPRRFEDGYSLKEADRDVVLSRETMEAVKKDVVREYSLGRSCVLFFSLKDEVREYLTLLEKYIPKNKIGVYYGDQSNKDNNEVLKLAENGKIKVVLTTYSKSGEGTNCKAWEVAFLVSSIADGKTVQQVAGRVRRIKKGKIPVARIYDYRYINAYPMKGHIVKRNARYKKLGFKIKNSNAKKKSPFGFGYKF